MHCGSQLSLRENDPLTACPSCGANGFQRDSIFESMQEHGAATAESTAAAETSAPSWLEEVRKRLPAGSRHLACRDGDGEVALFPVEPGWTRIGRSVSADIRLDDPSVSRRHALVVSEPDRALRVLDDRSLNGVLIDGEPVEWGKLEDGDELGIGRFRLFVVEA